MPFCPKCGKEVSEDARFCPQCGQSLRVGTSPENTSGQGASAIVPEEVKGWSWAGFGLTWIWGVFNGVLISLLALIPGFTLIWAIVLGIKGNEWSWRNKKWDSVEHFKNSQRPWNIAGIVVFAIGVIASIAIIPGVLIPLFLFG
jgi:zinc-ribbon domain